MLLKRLRELGARLSDIETALLEEHSKDWDEMAIEREGEEVLESLGAAGQAEIVQIRLALDRLNDGTYGVCATCGEEISAARLYAVPYAMVCRRCAAT
ncbi:TraR/DksA family transcriptional regulator [Primorskyibacter sp. 2E107]|uniref:TraR/DksA family transcriptional regulator n=1 Tax=Primorskyibacter sp. 2E107 TaxID=3403458 RepID=UPI003AF9BF73